MIDDVASISECGVESLNANTFINTKIEMKKLPLNVKKCKKLHMGKSNTLCPDLKAHKNNMIDANKEKYLGDQISNDGENKSNISERKGYWHSIPNYVSTR